MQEIRTFEGGLNMDDEERLIAPNEYRYALNIRNQNTQGSSNGVITPVEGSTEVVVSLPGGDNRVIGRIDDIANNRMIYIVWNSEGQNRVLAYYYGDEEVRTVFIDAGNSLGLHHSRFITGIDLIMGDDDTQMLFVTGEGEPRSLNIDAGIRTFDTTYKVYEGEYTLGSGADVVEGDVYYVDVSIGNNAGGTSSVRFYYRAVVATSNDPCTSTDPTPTTDWEFCPSGYIYPSAVERLTTVIVKPPLSPPKISLSSNETINSNSIYGSIWQFKYRYISPDGRESSWSPIGTAHSDRIVPDGTINKVDYIVRYINNEIKVGVNMPSFIECKAIQVAVRKCNSNEAPGDFKLLSVVNADDMSSVAYDDINSTLVKTISFTNNEPLVPLNQVDVNQLFSWVPRDVHAQAVASKNRLIYSNFTEGRPYSPSVKTGGRVGLNVSPPTIDILERRNPLIDDKDPACEYSLFREDSAGAAAADGDETTDTLKLTTPVSALTQDKLWIVIDSATANRPLQLDIKFDVPLDPFQAYPPIDISITVIPDSAVTAPTTSAALSLIKKIVDALNKDPKRYVGLVSGVSNTTFAAYTASQEVITSGPLAGYYYVKITPHQETLGSFTFPYFIESRPVISYPSKYVPRTFKRGSTPQLGIAYSDAYGRISSVLTTPSMRFDIPWWNHDNTAALEDIGQILAKVNIYHDAPPWAESYHILMGSSNGYKYHVSMPFSKSGDLKGPSATITNPLNDRYFIRGWVTSLEDTPSTTMAFDATSGSPAMELIYIPLNALQGGPQSIASQNGSSISYDFVKGDRFRLCYYVDYTDGDPDSTDNYFDETFDCEIIGYNETLNCIIIRPSDLPSILSDTPSTGITGLLHVNNANGSGSGLDGVTGANTNIRGTVFEIYRPDLDLTNSIYHEIYSGKVYESTDTAGNRRYFHKSNQIETVTTGSISPTWVSGERDQTSAQSAILYVFGDVYLKPRDYITNYNASAPDTSEVNQFYVEDANLYDSFPSKTWGIGRPNRVIRMRSTEETYSGLYGLSKRRSTMRFSQSFNPESNYNGLGTFYDIDFKDTNPSKGAIQLLHSDGDRVFVYHENGVGYLRVDQQFIQTLDNQTLAVAANTPISDIQYYSTNAGIGNTPESFVRHNSRQYFVDVTNGQVCRLSGDGITAISQYKVNSFFRPIFKEMQKSPVRPQAWGAYDKRFDEYMINMKWGSEILFQGQDISFDGGDTITVGVASVNLYEIFVGQVLSFRVPSFVSGGVNYSGISGSCVVVSIDYNTGSLTIRFKEGYLLTEDGEYITQEDGGYIIIGDSDAYDIVQLAEEVFITLNRFACISFNENITKWTSTYNFFSESIYGAGLDLFSFRAGKLCIHSNYNNPATFVGDGAKDIFFDIVSNKTPHMVKVYKNMSLKSDATWSEFNADAYIARVPVSPTLTGTGYAMTTGVRTSAETDHTVIPYTFAYKEQQLVAGYSGVKTDDETSFFGREKARGYWTRTRIQIANKAHKFFSVTFEYILSNLTR